MISKLIIKDNTIKVISKKKKKKSLYEITSFLYIVDYESVFRKVKNVSPIAKV